MKRLLFVLLCAASLSCFAPSLSAQSDHINVGIFGNLLRVSDSKIDLAGVGARVSVNVWSKLQFEAESAYNFEESFSQGFSDFNGTVTLSQSRVRTLDGLFGPKLYTNRGPVRLFGTVKGGFINFNLDTTPGVTIQTVTSTFSGLNGSNILGVLYVGGGGEAFWGPIGLRADVGDEIFFNHGGNHNLKVSFGPTIRF